MKIVVNGRNRAQLVNGDKGITWDAVNGTNSEVAVERMADDGSIFEEGKPPSLGDRLLRVGDQHVAVTDDMRANNAVNDHVRGLIEEAANRNSGRIELYFAPHREVSQFLLSMSHIFEKFEADKYWYGLFLLTVRLWETSMLVFFKKRTTKAMVATAVSVISLTIAQKCKPWLRDSDDQVWSIARARRNLSQVL